MIRSVLIALLVSIPVVASQHLTPDNQPIEPFRIADSVFYVGSSDIASYLITTRDGDILIDGGYVETAPMIEANIQKVGARIRDVRVLLNTQAHFDHTGGLAELKRLSGAQMIASAADAPVLERGGHGDFLFGDQHPFPPVRVDRIIADGEQVRVGGTVLTAHLTPGHTKGCTTWTWDATDKGRTYHVVDVCGLTILDGVDLRGMPGYPDIGRDFEQSFRTLRALPCEIFLGAHASYYGGAEKAAMLRSHPTDPNPFVDPTRYRVYLDRAEERFRQRQRR